MTKHEVLDVPNWALDVATKVGKLPLISYLSGSNSSGYRKVEWSRVDQVLDSSLQPRELHLTPADPHANIAKTVIRRLMDKAVVLQIYRSQIDELEAHNEGQFAAAFTYDGVTRAAVIPEICADPNNRYSVGLREGPNVFGVGLGVVTEDMSRFITATGVYVFPHTPIKELDEFYPEALLL